MKTSEDYINRGQMRQLQIDRLHFSVAFEVDPSKVGAPPDKRLFFALTTRSAYHNPESHAN